MHNLNKKGAVAPPWLTPVIAICSVIKTTLYVTHLYSKVVFVEALRYVGRSSIEIQHALWDFNKVSQNDIYFSVKALFK